MKTRNKYKSLLKDNIIKLYHTKQGQVCWRLFSAFANRPFIHKALSKALDIPENNQDIHISLTGPRYSKNALVIFPFWGTDATTQNIMSMCGTLRELGYIIHAVKYDNSTYNATSSFFDYTYNITSSNIHFGRWRVSENHSEYDSNLIDDWVDDHFLMGISTLSKVFSFDLCLCNYVFLSAALTVLPDNTYKILYTHDIFANRNSRMAKVGITEKNFYFSTSAHEESKALMRADTVIAVQEQEQEYFTQTVCADNVLTLPYVPPKNYLPHRPPEATLVVGYLGSAHGPNVKAIEELCEALKRLSADNNFKLVVAGAVCVPLRELVLPHFVQLLGHVESIGDFYASCDVLINPDMLLSGLKVKCVEAFAHGKPLICTAPASTGISVTKAYHLLPDITACAHAIQELATDTTLLADMSTESKRVYDAFSERYSSYNTFRHLDFKAREKRQVSRPTSPMVATPKVSVIMPTYNVERYFEQCLQSVMDQTLTEIEIIPVDDGSPDACGAIMDAYALRDPRIKPIHQKNGGYGKAINVGLQAATGEYIAIVETDDWVEPDMFDTLYNAAIRWDTPVAKGSFYKHERERSPYVCGIDIDFGGKKELLCPTNDIHLMLAESSIWSAIYKKDYLATNAITMLETSGAAYQDVVWKFMTYAPLNSVVLINKPVYHYRVLTQNSSSFSKNKADAMFINYTAIENFLKKQEKFEKFCDSYYAHQSFDFVFHSKRLGGEALQCFYQQAELVVKKAQLAGFSLGKMAFNPNTNDYVQKEVLPLYHRLLGEKISVREPKTAPSQPSPINIPQRANWWQRGKRKKTQPLSLRALEKRSSEISVINDKLAALEKRISSIQSSTFAEIETAPSGQFAYYLRANSGTLQKKIEDFKYGMDELSTFYVDRYFKLFTLLPQTTHVPVNYKFPLTMGILSDEERFILSNKDVLLKKIRNDYANLDMSEVPISLHNMYFEGGLQFVPYRLTEQFAGTIALDCGAWVGDSAIPIARYGFKEVHCFEPMPDTYPILVRNIEKNNLSTWLKPHQLAVGGSNGTVTFKKVGESGDGSLVSTEGTITCQSTTIDTFCQTLPFPVSLIKLDIEGQEIPALLAAVETIKTYKPVLLVSVYHTWVDPEQLFAAKEFIEHLNLGYEFQFKCMQPEKSLLYEYILVCYCKHSSFGNINDINGF